MTEFALNVFSLINLFTIRIFILYIIGSFGNLYCQESQLGEVFNRKYIQSKVEVKKKYCFYCQYSEYMQNISSVIFIESYYGNLKIG